MLDADNYETNRDEFREGGVEDAARVRKAADLPESSSGARRMWHCHLPVCIELPRVGF